MPTITANGVTLAYDDYGQGEPILFIHGIFVSRAAWYPQINYFAQTHRVITYDMRGHGESSASDDRYSVALFAQDAVALLDALGLERAVCCGHSFGGMVAQELALSHPGRVSRLILAESSYGVRSTPWEAALTEMTMLCTSWVSLESQVQLFANFFGMFTPQATEAIQQEGLRHLRDTQNFHNILRASLAFDSRWRLHRIACPTLILLGQYFHVPWIYLHSYEMLWWIRAAQLKLIPRAGHVLNWDNPSAFNGTVKQFLAG
ncbi:MAG: alpha/beta hydrolase [Anaerolineae bacterium]